METETLFNGYLTDADFASLPRILQDDHDSDQILNFDVFEEHQSSQLAPGKVLADDVDGMDTSTISPSWLSRLQFEPISNPESSGDPSPDFSGSIDEYLNTEAVVNQEELTQFFMPMSMPMELGSKEEVHLKLEEMDDLLLSPISPVSPFSPVSSVSPGPAPPSARKRRKRAANNSDKTRRQKFLERNRVAASKCRRKKKEAEQALEGLQKQMEEEHMALKSMQAALMSEFMELQTLMTAHSGCANAPINQWLATRSGRLGDVAGSEARVDMDHPLDRTAPTPTEVNAQPSRPLSVQVSLQPNLQTMQDVVRQTPRSLLQQPLLAESYQPPAHAAITLAFDESPQLCAVDAYMMPSKHVRPASMVSTVSSYLSPISPMYAEFPDTVGVDLIKAEPVLDAPGETDFESLVCTE